ncbi:MAG TPA: hypothetical protein VEV17_21520 [Bryobacteraceae bacterium]|nr:hypothetical protein [Bryobacteraceae bacterium]
MSDSTAEYGIASWTSPAVPLTIEYPLEIMEELRAVVCDAIQQPSPGGLAAAGVLFGMQREGAIRILTWRPIAPEPSGWSSSQERAGVARLLESAAADADLQGLVPLGWFTSRTSGGIALTLANEELYNSLFPHPWQCALVLGCGRGGLARAGFFVRRADGGLKADASYRTFTIEPLQRAPAEPEPPAQSPPDPVDIEMPSFQLQQHSFGGARWLWVFPVLLALAVIVFLWKQKSLAAPAPTFSLRVAGTANDVEISWDREAPAVRDADRAVIEIQDGPATSQLKLAPDQVRSGSAHYFRQSGDVGFAMTIYPSGGPELREFARLIVQESAAAPAPAKSDQAGMQLRAERDALAGEVELFKDQVRKESDRAAKLQEQVRTLENRLRGR